MLETAIADYHAALQDEALARETWEALTVGQRERNLFFGDRPLATVMRPRLLTRPQYDLLRHGVGLVVAALQRLGDAVLADAALRDRIALTPQEEALLARDPGYPYHSAHSRMDTFLTLDGASLQFVEYNGESPVERYKGVVEEMQQLALQLLIFGMHVHVGVPDDEVAIELMNVARYFLPRILALSTSSPFWMGRNTGFKSYRSALFANFPRTGIPPSFHSAAEFHNYVNLLIRTNCIDDAKKVYWDLRPHPYFGTLEFRICDAATRVDECIALAALMQALIVKLHRMFSENTTFRVCRRAVIMENKWRAQRWGLDGKLIDFGKRAEVDARALMHELVAFVDEALDELGSRQEVEYLLRIAEGGSSADRQLAVFRETNDLNAVVDNLIVETLEGVPVYQG